MSLRSSGLQLQLIKIDFAKAERAIWQRRFWEHLIRDDEDFRRHVAYCYINPVKHGLVTRVRDWPHSSFHRDVRAGLFPEDWGATFPLRAASASVFDMKRRNAPHPCDRARRAQ